MLCKYYWIVLYTVHVTAFCLGGPFFSGHGVCMYVCMYIHMSLPGMRICPIKILKTCVYRFADKSFRSNLTFSGFKATFSGPWLKKVCAQLL